MKFDDEEVWNDPALSVEPNADREVESMETADQVRSVLQSMPDGARIPLVLRDMDGLAYDEIAERLGLSLSATKMRILRARERFRALYSTTDPEDGDG